VRALFTVSLRNVETNPLWRPPLRQPCWYLLALTAFWARRVWQACSTTQFRHRLRSSFLTIEFA